MKLLIGNICILLTKNNKNQETRVNVVKYALF